MVTSGDSSKIKVAEHFFSTFFECSLPETIQLKIQVIVVGKEPSVPYLCLYSVVLITLV